MGYRAWDGLSYEGSPPAGWYQASDGCWWPEGTGPGVEKAEVDVGSVAAPEQRSVPAPPPTPIIPEVPQAPVSGVVAPLELQSPAPQPMAPQAMAPQAEVASTAPSNRNSLLIGAGVVGVLLILGLGITVGALLTSGDSGESPVAMTDTTLEAQVTSSTASSEPAAPAAESTSTTTAPASGTPAEVGPISIAGTGTEAETRLDQFYNESIGFSDANELHEEVLDVFPKFDQMSDYQILQWKISYSENWDKVSSEIVFASFTGSAEVNEFYANSLTSFGLAEFSTSEASQDGIDYESVIYGDPLSGNVIQGFEGLSVEVSTGVDDSGVVIGTIETSFKPTPGELKNLPDGFLKEMAAYVPLPDDYETTQLTLGTNVGYSGFDSISVDLDHSGERKQPVPEDQLIAELEAVGAAYENADSEWELDGNVSDGTYQLYKNSASESLTLNLTGFASGDGSDAYDSTTMSANLGTYIELDTGITS